MKHTRTIRWNSEAARLLLAQRLTEAKFWWQKLLITNDSDIYDVLGFVVQECAKYASHVSNKRDFPINELEESAIVSGRNSKFGERPVEELLDYSDFMSATFVKLPKPQPYTSDE